MCRLRNDVFDVLQKPLKIIWRIPVNIRVGYVTIATWRVVAAEKARPAEEHVDAALTAALRTLHEDAGDPFIGNPDASIVIYEFSDYNCGYCKRVFTPLQQLLAEDDDAKLVVKEFPILSQTSMLAAQAAVAAQAQGVFPAFHVTMMTARGAVSMDTIMAAARGADADLERLQADMNSAEVAMIIERTRATAQ